MPARFVITGGPGSGKSTLIEALRAAGHKVVEEAGRAIIREEAARGGDALPWGDPVAYARRMLAHDLAAWEASADADGPVFFDRGIPDVQGYLRLIARTPRSRYCGARLPLRAPGLRRPTLGSDLCSG